MTKNIFAVVYTSRSDSYDV